MSEAKPDAPPKAAAKPRDGLQPDGTWRITLTRPVETAEGPKEHLILKDPPGSMVIKHGLPWHQKVKPDADGQVEWIDVEHDGRKMAAYLEVMTGIDQMTLETLSGRDLSACFTAIFQMLQPAGN